MVSSRAVSEVVADLDEVLVGVAEVDAADRAGGPGALDWSLLDDEVVCGESAITSSSGPVVIRHRSALPGVGRWALGSNS
jgi:hypothetical protein